jgi:hypothetical protein
MVLAIVLSVLAYLAYHKIYMIGYNAANTECTIRITSYEKKMKEYQDSLDKRIDLLVVTSSQLVTELSDSRESLKKDYTAILTTIKNKPLYRIEKGA